MAAPDRPTVFSGVVPVAGTVRTTSPVEPVTVKDWVSV